MNDDVIHRCHLEWSNSLSGGTIGEGWDGGNISYCVEGLEFRTEKFWRGTVVTTASNVTRLIAEFMHVAPGT